MKDQVSERSLEHIQSKGPDFELFLKTQLMKQHSSVIVFNLKLRFFISILLCVCGDGKKRPFLVILATIDGNTL